MRTILHVDMDAFFASVEQLDDPSLRGKPVVVGGRSRRGVVAAASYEARVFGVRSAMPMVEALARCPEAIVVTPHFERYQELSAQVFAIFRRYTPEVEGLSLDEAFLDVTGSRSLFGSGEVIARRIKAEVRAETGLVCSAGVAPNKLVAKIASDLDKPDGLVVVAPEDVRALLAPLPIERLPGVGPKTAMRLHAAGYETLGQLASATAQQLDAALGASNAHASGARLGAMARGEDEREVESRGAAKSIGAERTLERDLHTLEEIEHEILRHASRVAARLVEADLHAQIVVVKIKYADHVSRTRRARLDRPVADTDAIFEAARGLAAGFPNLKRGVRLVGVSLAELVTAPAPELFPDEARLRRDRLERAVAQVKDRFGGGKLTRARLLGDDSERGD